MKKISTYPIFEKDQVLTAKQLNDVHAFLDQQDRLTRTRAVGIGIICGFEVSKDKQGGRFKGLRISQGCGITSKGYVIPLDATTYPFQRSFKHSYFKDLEVTELLEDNAAGDAHMLGESYADDKIVVLFLELFDRDLRTCTGSDCDEKGRQIEYLVRPVLVDKNDIRELVAVKPRYAQRRKLRRFAVPRCVQDLAVHLSRIDSEQALVRHYSHLIEEFDLKRFAQALEDCFDAYQPYLDIPSNPFSNSDLIAAVKKFNKASGTIQYVYDFLKDLVDAYHAFITEAEALRQACMPDEKLFPQHLLLGGVGASSYDLASIERTGWIASPAHNATEQSNRKVKSLFARLQAMYTEFDIGTFDTAIITPGSDRESELGHRAIPYYYPVTKNSNVLTNWNFELLKAEKAYLNYSYHADRYPFADTPDFIRRPIEYALDKFPFFRIEGHINQPWPYVFKELKNHIQRCNLPFKLLGLRVDTAAQEDIPDRADFADYEALYDQLRLNLICKLDNVDAFLARPGSSQTPQKPTIVKGNVSVSKRITGVSKIDVAILDIEYKKFLTLRDPVENLRKIDIVAREALRTSGNFEFKDVKPGKYTLVGIASPGFKVAAPSTAYYEAVEASVINGKTLDVGEIKIDLSSPNTADKAGIARKTAGRSGALGGTVVDAQKKGISQAVVGLAPPSIKTLEQYQKSLRTPTAGKGAPLTQTASDGSFVLEGIPAGDYSLIVFGRGNEFVARSVSAQSGAVKDLGVIELTSGKSVTDGSLQGSGSTTGEKVLVGGHRSSAGSSHKTPENVLRLMSGGGGGGGMHVNFPMMHVAGGSSGSSTDKPAMEENMMMVVEEEPKEMALYESTNDDAGNIAMIKDFAVDKLASSTGTVRAGNAGSAGSESIAYNAGLTNDFITDIVTNYAIGVQPQYDKPQQGNQVAEFLDKELGVGGANSIYEAWKYGKGTYGALEIARLAEDYGIKIDVINTIQYPTQIESRIAGLKSYLQSHKSISSYAEKDFTSFYDPLISKATEYKESLQSDNNGHDISECELMALIDHLDILIFDCSLSYFAELLAAYVQRREAIRELIVFANFVKRHPGIEHLGGVPKGGTFIVVYDEKKRVIADFALPYICCSDAPPINYMVVDEAAKLTLPETIFCSDYSGDAPRFDASPQGGEVIGPGVTLDAGNFVFDPKDAGPGTHAIRYEILGQARAFLQVTIVGTPQAGFDAEVVERVAEGVRVKLTNTTADDGYTYRWLMTHSAMDKPVEISDKQQPGEMRIPVAEDVATITVLLEATNSKHTIECMNSTEQAIEIGHYVEGSLSLEGGRTEFCNTQPDKLPQFMRSPNDAVVKGPGVSFDAGQNAYLLDPSVPAPGTHTFELELNGSILDSAELTILETPQPQLKATLLKRSESSASIGIENLSSGAGFEFEYFYLHEDLQSPRKLAVSGTPLQAEAAVPADITAIKIIVRGLNKGDEIVCSQEAAFDLSVGAGQPLSGSIELSKTVFCNGGVTAKPQFKIDPADAQVVGNGVETSGGTFVFNPNGLDAGVTTVALESNGAALATLDITLVEKPKPGLSATIAGRTEKEVLLDLANSTNDSGFGYRWLMDIGAATPKEISDRKDPGRISVAVPAGLTGAKITLIAENRKSGITCQGIKSTTVDIPPPAQGGSFSLGSDVFCDDDKRGHPFVFTPAHAEIKGKAVQKTADGFEFVPAEAGAGSHTMELIAAGAVVQTMTAAVLKKPLQPEFEAFGAERQSSGVAVKVKQFINEPGLSYEWFLMDPTNNKRFVVSNKENPGELSIPYGGILSNQDKEFTLMLGAYREKNKQRCEVVASQRVAI
ncbi:MAG: hypothetical protein GF398_17840 [Chitinivibrionales bacterium]|nr:hypothetical protein [Chitinivibrionales bacterium]